MSLDPDGITVTCVNNRTGDSWTRHLGPDEYAVVHGPELAVTERRIPLRGGITIALLPVKPRR